MMRRPQSQLRIHSLTHDILGDPFWSVYDRGICDAEAALECPVTRFRPASYTPEAMLKALDEALRGRPDGLVCTIPDADILDAPLRAAIASGTAVIATNARDPRSPDAAIPYMRFVGGNDYGAGSMIGETLAERGLVANVLCIDHYLHDQHCHTQRFEGLVETVAKSGGRCRRQRIAGDRLGEAVSRVGEALAGDKGISAIVTLGPPGADAGLAACEEHGRRIPHVSYDLSDRQVEALRDGRLLATIDSQQYLQGFWGVMLAWQYLRFGVLPLTDILTGPRLLFASDLKRQSELAAAAL